MEKVKEKEVLFEPDLQRVLVLPDEYRETRTKSGIIIPSAAKEDKPQQGTIVVTGKGDADLPMRYKAGEKVLYSTYAGIEVTLNIKGVERNDFKVMNQMDIMGRITELF